MESLLKNGGNNNEFDEFDEFDDFLNNVITKNRKKNILLLNYVENDIINDFDNNNDNNDNDDICNNCHSNDIVEEKGYITCRSCGCLGQEIISSGPEWRDYGQYDSKNGDPSRCGMPSSEIIPNLYIGSVFSQKYNESYQSRRIRNMQTWGSISYQDSTTLKSFTDMTNVCNISGINLCILEDAKAIYRKIYMIKSNKKTKKRTLQATSVFWACKKKGVARGSSEIAKSFGISSKEMRKGCKFMENVWNAITYDNNDNDEDEVMINLDNQDDKSISDKNKSDETNDKYSSMNLSTVDTNDYKPSNSLDFLHRCCAKLNILDDIYQIIYSVCDYVEKNNWLSNHIPLSRTACCIYFTCHLLNIKISKSNIDKICRISEVTINKCFQKIMKHSDSIIQNTSLKNYVSQKVVED